MRDRRGALGRVGHDDLDGPHRREGAAVQLRGRLAVVRPNATLLLLADALAPLLPAALGSDAHRTDPRAELTPAHAAAAFDAGTLATLLTAVAPAALASSGGAAVQLAALLVATLRGSPLCTAETLAAAVTPAVIALDYACDKTWKPRVTLSENSSTGETEPTENEAPEADSKETTPMPDADTGVGPNTLSAEELRALKERLRAEATAALTQPSGEPSHAGAPQVGTHNPMERQELNHLILNTDENATSDDFDLPFVNEIPARVDPIEATTQPPASNGTDENDS